MLKNGRALAVAALAAQPGVPYVDLSNEAYAASVGLPYAANPSAPMEPGQIYLANDAMFLEANFQEPLTNYAVAGWDKQDTYAELRRVAPEIPVSRYFQYAVWSNPESFYAEPSGDDVRAIGADFKQVEYTSTKVVAKTLNRGLTIRLDRDQLRGMPNWEQQYVARLMARIQRNCLIRAYTVLGAAAVTTARNWAASSTVDPDGDIRSTVFQGQKVSGLRPNTVIYGRTAWDKRFLAYRQDSNATRALYSTYSPEEVMRVLGVDSVQVSESFYQSTSSTKLEILGSNVFAFYQQTQPTVEDPSNLKRFVSPVEGGGYVRVFITPQNISAKWVEITVEYYDLITSPYTGGIREDQPA